MNPNQSPVSFATTDLCDANEARLLAGRLRVLYPAFRPFGRRSRFAGPSATVRCFEDNSAVRTALEEAGEGRVLIVDGGGSLRCALLGDLIAADAVKNGWEGLVIDGCVRDCAALRELPIGIRALAATPRKSTRRNEGQTGIEIQIGGVVCRSGDRVYADEDGVLLLDSAVVRRISP